MTPHVLNAAVPGRRSPHCRWPRMFCCALLAGLMMQVAYAGDDPRVWLDRMHMAMNQMTYQGTFLFASGDRWQTLRVVHVADEHGVRERLSAISGPEREIIRDAKGMRWYAGNDQPVLADPPVQLPMFLDPRRVRTELEESYELSLAGSERIAGHEGQRLDIRARDGYRYSFSIWLEQDSGLLLQWQLRDSAENTIARLSFTELRIGAEVDKRDALASAGADNQQHMTELPAEAPVAAGKTSGTWQPGWLPPGFQLASVHVPGENSRLLEHQVYSDGIAAVSVYLEQPSAQPNPKPWLGRVGFGHFYKRETPQISITIVGDVPALTVQQIGQADFQPAP